MYLYNAHWNSFGSKWFAFCFLNFVIFQSALPLSTYPLGHSNRCGNNTLIHFHMIDFMQEPFFCVLVYLKKTFRIDCVSKHSFMMCAFLTQMILTLRLITFNLFQFSKLSCHQTINNIIVAKNNEVIIRFWPCRSFYVIKNQANNTPL